MKKKTKAEIKEGLKEGCGEVVGEIVITLVFMAIGILVLSLFGVEADAEWVDDEITVLIGLGAIIIPAIIIGAIVHAVKKKKKNSIKKIEIHSKNEDEQTEIENEETQENNSDETEKEGQDDV